MDYTVTVELPSDVKSCGSICIEDVIPDRMTFKELVSIHIKGKNLINVTEMEAIGNKIRFTLNGFYLEDSVTIELVLKFNISEEANGELENTVNVYITPVNSNEPNTDKPSDIATAIITPQDTYTVTYESGWPGDGTGTGSAPIDDNDYIPGTTAIVQPPSETFAKNGWAFLGWDTDPDADTPKYKVDGNTVTNPVLIIDEDVILHPIWAEVPKIDEISKIAESNEYAANGIVNYIITFKLPDDISTYGSIRAEDVFPAGLTYTGLVSAKAGGTSILTTVDTAASGKVSFIISKSELKDKDGATVELVVKFNADADASGNLTNAVNVYVTPLNGKEPNASDANNSETVTPRETYTVIYELDWPGDGEPGTGEAPVDDNDYNYGDEVSVLPPPDGLTKDDWAFIGWDTAPDAVTPMYIVEDGTVTGPPLVIGKYDVELHAIWTEVPKINKVTKTAANGEYTAGGTMNYTISSTLPADVAAYENVRIEDVISAGLTYDSLVSAKIDGNVIIPATDNSVPNKVSFIISKSDLKDNAAVEIIIKFKIDITASGNLKNTVNVYVTPINGGEFITPDTTGYEIITGSIISPGIIIPGNTITPSDVPVETAPPNVTNPPDKKTTPDNKKSRDSSGDDGDSLPYVANPPENDLPADAFGNEEKNPLTGINITFSVIGLLSSSAVLIAVKSKKKNKK